MDATGAPILIGCLYDFPKADGGTSFEDAVRLGIADVMETGRIDREIELRPKAVQGLPLGTERSVQEGFLELEAAGVLAILGPSISDNALITRPLADRFRVPCINYTGGGMTRSEFMFHYQVGSLEEEPPLLARHVAGLGHRTMAVIYDNSPVGRIYFEYLVESAALLGLEITGSAAISPISSDITAVVERLRSAKPDCLLYFGLGVAARAVSLAVNAQEWKVPVFCNSSLMFGYLQPDWRSDWEGWVYVDSVADENTSRIALKERSKVSASGPVLVAAYDMGRLIAEGIARSQHLTREGIRDGLERVKGLPATTGYEGTTMGFGGWDRGALKGGFLVLRRWENGRTVQV